MGGRRRPRILLRLSEVQAPPLLGSAALPEHDVDPRVLSGERGLGGRSRGRRSSPSTTPVGALQYREPWRALRACERSTPLDDPTPEHQRGTPWRRPGRTGGARRRRRSSSASRRPPRRLRRWCGRSWRRQGVLPAAHASKDMTRRQSGPAANAHLNRQYVKIRVSESLSLPKDVRSS